MASASGSRSTGYESTSPQKRGTTCSRHSCSGSHTVPGGAAVEVQQLLTVSTGEQIWGLLKSTAPSKQ